MKPRYMSKYQREAKQAYYHIAANSASAHSLTGESDVGASVAKQGHKSFSDSHYTPNRDIPWTVLKCSYEFCKVVGTNGQLTLDVNMLK